MAWLWWQQHRADRAEARAMRLYVERRAGQREVRDRTIDTRRRDETIVRLNTALGGDPRS
jgi:hypothetical protein